MLDKDKYKHTEITEKIIGAYYAVYNQLGYGFLEKVYENAMCIVLSWYKSNYTKGHKSV